MANKEKQAVVTLNRLLRLCTASEKGFNVAGENVKNRGLKVMFKSYAHERAHYASELQRVVSELGGEPAEGSGLLAAAHRGWINIKSAMTIGQPATENVVLAEVVRGENVAIRKYEEALRRSLPAKSQALVERQFERVREVNARVQELQGREGKRLVVRLYNSDDDANEAIAALTAANFDSEQMEKVPLHEAINIYEGRHINDMTGESALAGALVGAGLGIVLGLVAGISTMITPGGSLFQMGLAEIFLWTTLIGAVAGLFFGALIGAIIGLGVSQEDDYGYHRSVAQGSLLLLLRTDATRATEASTIMRGINVGRWRLAT